MFSTNNIDQTYGHKGAFSNMPLSTDRYQCWFGYLVANTFCNGNFSIMVNLGVNSIVYGFLGAISICLKTKPNIQILKLQQGF